MSSSQPDIPLPEKTKTIFLNLKSSKETYRFSYATDPRLFDWIDSFRELEKDHIVQTDVLPVLEELGMKQELESGMKVVDIGCGSANISCAIAKLYPNSTFTGFEYTESGVERARENVRQNGSLT
ncbi:hypothetical protein CHS0354_039586 [Potamilus streckersoni]|uniref:Methyltransferase domain-containing protein n=1 Tax=Potamilus streckersoni TaxID=2493646 RepID=A0AAE0VHF6_9BIVA|nr:hypothetical protein CHS0354_039586 [Potamilus streckersoni]